LLILLCSVGAVSCPIVISRAASGPTKEALAVTVHTARSPLSFRVAVTPPTLPTRWFGTAPDTQLDACLVAFLAHFDPSGTAEHRAHCVGLVRVHPQSDGDS
jgi:hypothetical protein